MNTPPKDIQKKLRALGIYQITGGIIGIGITLWLINLFAAPALLLVIVLLALGLYAYSIYCGVLVLKNAKRGLKLSKINQLLQLVSFSAFGYAFQYVSGAFMSVGLDLTESLNFKFNTGISSWQININSDNPFLIININLLALFLIMAIDKLQNKMNGLALEEKITIIGQEEEAQVETQG
jgi:hypothetical protein